MCDYYLLCEYLIMSSFQISLHQQKKKTFFWVFLFTKPGQLSTTTTKPRYLATPLIVTSHQTKPQIHFFFAHQNIETDIRMRSNLRQRAATDVHTSRQFSWTERVSFHLVFRVIACVIYRITRSKWDLRGTQFGNWSGRWGLVIPIFVPFPSGIWTPV